MYYLMNIYLLTDVGLVFLTVILFLDPHLENAWKRYYG